MGAGHAEEKQDKLSASMIRGKITIPLSAATNAHLNRFTVKVTNLSDANNVTLYSTRNVYDHHGNDVPNNVQYSNGDGWPSNKDISIPLNATFLLRVTPAQGYIVLDVSADSGVLVAVVWEQGNNENFSYLVNSGLPMIPVP